MTKQQQYHSKKKNSGKNICQSDQLKRYFELPWWLSGKEPSCQCKRWRCKRHGFHPSVGKIPWKREWQPTPVFLPGESHGRGAWQATVHGVTQSRTRLKGLSTQAQVTISLEMETVSREDGADRPHGGGLAHLQS